MKTSKINKVEMLPEWSNSHGTYYPHKIHLENNDVGIINKKSKNAYSKGQELTYELNGTDNVGNNKIKEIKPEFNGYKKSQGNNASFALSYAKDLAIANISQGKEVTAKQVVKVAETFNDWLKAN